MKNLFTISALIAAQVAAETIILSPVVETGNEIAIVWIHGMDCQNTAYETIAQEV